MARLITVCRFTETAAWMLCAAIVLDCSVRAQTPASFGPSSSFGTSNPFYARSTLPFQAPPFGRIKDSDYQPAIDAGIAEETKEIDAIANNPAPPDLPLTRSSRSKRPGSFASGSCGPLMR